MEVTMFWLFVTVLWAGMLLSPFILLYLFLPAGSDCPKCSAETIVIRSPLLAMVKRFACFRWCLTCGWEGVTRRTVLRHPLPRFEVVPDDTDESEDAPWRSS